MTQHPQANWQSSPGQGPNGAPPGYSGPTQYAPQGVPIQAHTPETPRTKSKVPIIVAGVLALALVVGGAFFAFTFFRGGAAPAAAETLPKDAVMAAELNLNPSMDQQLAVAEWVKRLPQGSDIDTTNYKEGLYTWLQHQNPDLPDWDKVEPWLGDSAAIASIKDSEGIPREVFSLAVKDKAAAENFYEEQLAQDYQKIFVKDSIVLWSSQHDVTIDADQITSDPLSESEHYKDLMGRLPSTNLGTVYISQEQFDALSSESGTPTADIEVRMAGALTASKDIVTLEMASWQSESVAAGEDVKAFVGDMDAEAAAAAGFSLSEEAIKKLAEKAEELGQFNLESLGIKSAEDLKAILGKQIAFSVGGDLAAGSPEVGFKVKGADHERLDQLIAQVDTSSVVETSTEGDTYFGGYGLGPDDVKSPREKLKDSQDFKKATNNESGEAIVWVNIAAIRNMLGSEVSPEVRETLDQIAGAGLVVSTKSDGYAAGTLRIVAEN